MCAYVICIQNCLDPYINIYLHTMNLLLSFEAMTYDVQALVFRQFFIPRSTITLFQLSLHNWDRLIYTNSCSHIHRHRHRSNQLLTSHPRTTVSPQCLYHPLLMHCSLSQLLASVVHTMSSFRHPHLRYLQSDLHPHFTNTRTASGAAGCGIHLGTSCCCSSFIHPLVSDKGNFRYCCVACAQMNV